MTKLIQSLIVFTSIVPGVLSATASEQGAAIRPSEDFPWRWEFRGEPTLLIGGSDDDNLFQMPAVAEHLDAIRSAGGNYVRNTMSDRPDKGHEVYPHARLTGGKYDLSKWNDTYWRRFASFLNETAERNIVVQIELWDRFDYSDAKAPNWRKHPYNPANNVNYTEAESGLATRYPNHPGRNDQPFFFTVPALDNNQLLLGFQQAFMDKVLSYTLQHGHVLYCIDNETSGREEWSAYWAEYIRKKANNARRTIYITEMWDAWDLTDKEHRRTFDHPERYAFVDTSQNNHNRGQKHWDNLQWVRRRLAEKPRPINHVKIYGADGGRFGDTRDGVERYWRNLFGGAASARFHRPDSGIGLSATAKQHLSATRLLLKEFDLVRAEPDAESDRLKNREPNEAYLAVAGKQQLAVYFPRGGEISLQLPAKVEWTVRWLNCSAGEWREGTTSIYSAEVSLDAPSADHWIAVVKP